MTLVRDVSYLRRHTRDTFHQGANKGKAFISPVTPQLTIGFLSAVVFLQRAVFFLLLYSARGTR